MSTKEVKYTEAEIVRWIDERLDHVLDQPRAWGDENSLEPVVLSLVMLREDFCDPMHGSARVRRAYRKHLARSGYDDDAEPGPAKLEALVAMLREFVRNSVRVDRPAPAYAPPHPARRRVLPGAAHPVDVSKPIGFLTFRQTG